MRSPTLSNNRPLFIAVTEQALIEIAELQLTDQIPIHRRVFKYAAKPASCGGGRTVPVRKRYQLHSAPWPGDTRGVPAHRSRVTLEGPHDPDGVAANVQPFIQRC